MADTTDPRNAPGVDAAMGGYTAATKSLQTFASEMQRMSKEAMDQTTQHMEKLRGARSMEDVVSVQTTFLQKSFANYAEYTRRFSELMMTLPMELARQSQSAFQQGTENLTKATERAGDEMKRAGDTITQG